MQFVSTRANAFLMKAAEEALVDSGLLAEDGSGEVRGLGAERVVRGRRLTRGLV